MRTLVVSEFWPGEPYGASMRIDLVCRTLAEFGPVDFLCLDYGPQPPRSADGLFRKVHTLSQSATPNPQGAVYGIPGVPMESRLAQARERSTAEVRGRVGREIYDLVWYNRERTWLIARDEIAAPAVIDIDDLEDLMISRWLDLGRDEQGGVLTESVRARMTADIDWWRAVHRQAAEQATVLAFASEADRRRVVCPKSVVLPNTYDGIAPLDPRPDGRRSPVILFQGSLGWPPNEDAAVWLVEEIAPRIRQQLPDLQVVLPGPAYARVKALATEAGVAVPGAVPSMTPYLRDADLVVVPLRVGGGTRIKILEAFAHRVPVVATSIGAEGLDAEPGRHLELADDPDVIAQRCVTLLRSSAARERLAENAHELYQARYRPANGRERIQQAVRMAVGPAAAKISGTP